MAKQPRDAGKTSGGGNLGHDQPQDVAEQTPIRNHPSSPDDARARRRDEGDSDPVMPSDDSTLRTKI